MSQTTFENLSLLVKRNPNRAAPDLRNLLLGSSTIPQNIPANHVLLRVDKFGFSANNVTYAALGEVPHYRYFDFHPAPKTDKSSPSEYGITPVWGFATIVASTLDALKTGERVYGYLPMSRYALVPVEPRSINKYSFYIPRPHLPADRRPYNTITRCANDPQYRSDRENETMLYRPLFWTSFWCEDWLMSTSYRSATHIIISSASAKTAFCLAYLIQKRKAQGGPNVTVVGLTSSKNLLFTNRLGLYNTVLPYNDVTTLPSTSTNKYLYIDVASNSSLNTQIATHLSTSLVAAVVLGMTNVDDASRTSPLIATAKSPVKMETFFMPEWLAERRKTLSVPQITQMQKVAWDWLMEDCTSWVKMVNSLGGEQVKKAFLETVESRVGPDVGQVLSLWEKGQLGGAKL
ncbi:hypothetical protein HK104_011141 [Borealophlyctis nickersoniae]|nr:hypothetical protein HK104_011141 [Borealophlyctis nickersoniae]